MVSLDVEAMERGEGMNLTRRDESWRSIWNNIRL